MRYRVQQRESNPRPSKGMYGGMALGWSKWVTYFKTTDLEQATEQAHLKRATFTETRVLDTNNTVIYY